MYHIVVILLGGIVAIATYGALFYTLSATDENLGAATLVAVAVMLAGFRWFLVPISDRLEKYR